MGEAEAWVTEAFFRRAWWMSQVHYGLIKEAEAQHTEEEDHTAAILLLTCCSASKRGRGNAEITSLSPVYALNVPYGTVTAGPKDRKQSLCFTPVLSAVPDPECRALLLQHYRNTPEETHNAIVSSLLRHSHHLRLGSSTFIWSLSYCSNKYCTHYSETNTLLTKRAETHASCGKASLSFWFIKV